MSTNQSGRDEEKDGGSSIIGKPIEAIESTNLSSIMEQIQSSLLVSTYEAGKVMILRSDGSSCHIGFHSVEKAMGIARHRGRLAIGSKRAVWKYHLVPSLGPKLDPPVKDCMVPFQARYTGDIDAHEMSFDGSGELWIVNTRFGCLCTFDDSSSFVPRWKPHFLSELQPEDRCHLNGLAMKDGQPAYVTALGETDTKGGWRENKANGGILMDVASNEIMTRGLSMPHSPRWYRKMLWLLESGEGTLSVVDRETGVTEVVAKVPGFARGVSFHKNLAFIGLSQVRESALFSGLPIIDRYPDRKCGVWVVDIGTGKTISRLEFTSGVQELFAVEVIPTPSVHLLDASDDHMLNTYVLNQKALD